MKRSFLIFFSLIGCCSFAGSNEIELKNRAKFEALRAHRLPVDQYAITASGPLGIRNLREIHDIDLIVTQELWETLSAEYGVVDTGSCEKIVFPDEDIEAFREVSFYLDPNGMGATVAERISQAEILDGLPFETLPNVLEAKRRMGREKDLKDIRLIEAYLANDAGNKSGS